MSELGEVKAAQLSLMHGVMSTAGKSHSGSPSPPSAFPSQALLSHTLPASFLSISSPPRAPLASNSNAPFVPARPSHDNGDRTAGIHPQESQPSSSAARTYQGTEIYHNPIGASTSPAVDISSENIMLFELDGERVAFDKTAVPNPPQVSFAGGLSRLFREWHQPELLTVSGRGIPIKNRAWFYKKRTNVKPFVWGVIRAKRHNWKASRETLT